MPEYNIGAIPGAMSEWALASETGRVVCGGGRAGQWDTRGVFGGGRDRPNSVARADSGVALGDNAKRMLVLSVRSLTKF